MRVDITEVLKKVNAVTKNLSPSLFTVLNKLGNKNLATCSRQKEYQLH